MNDIVIYTDGSCLKNPGGSGGFAAIVKWGNDITEYSGAEKSTTNNRMELRAAILGLSKLGDKPRPVTLVTDSKYVKNGITQWIKKWKKNNWKTYQNKPVKNKDLWLQLDSLTNKHYVTWEWIRGHNGNIYNEKCDALAVNEAYKMRRASK